MADRPDLCHCGKTRAARRAETDRIMGIVRGAEGWHRFGLGGDEIHYVRNGVSLCGRWAYTHGGDVFQPHLAARSTCQTCRGCQCPACKVTAHASDCAVHNAPAYPNGSCSCGATLAR